MGVHSAVKVGVIGGSGLYSMEGLRDLQEVALETPFGRPSYSYVTGNLDGVPMVFLPRHGRGHRLLPTDVNYRANVYGMKQLGVNYLISVSAVGSMKEHIHPGDVVLVDQFFDRTFKREKSFFGDGVVAHVSMADPVCPLLQQALLRSARALNIPAHEGGTYLCIEGPQFSTRGESLIYRSWGVDVIGMTNMPEAKLAREAEISYATMAMATDYDCWHEEEENVTVEAVVRTLQQNVAKARAIIADVVSMLPEDRSSSPAFGALKFALMTDKSAVPAETRTRLKLLVGDYL